MSEYKTKKDVIRRLSEIKDPTLNQYSFLSKVPDNLLTSDIITKILKKFPFAICYLNNQTEDICLEAIKINGHSLMYIQKKNQTKKICLEAIRKHGNNLMYVENQTPEICLEALNQPTISRTVLFHIKTVDQKYLNNINDCKEQLISMIKKKIIIDQL